MRGVGGRRGADSLQVRDLIIQFSSPSGATKLSPVLLFFSLCLNKTKRFRWFCRAVEGRWCQTLDFTFYLYHP